MLAMLSPDRYDRQLSASEFDPVLTLPEQKVNGFWVQHSVISKDTRLEMYGRGGFIRYDDEITITKLLEHHEETDTWSLWMSNSPSEVEDMKELAKNAMGDHILVAGLGMGILPKLLADVGKQVTVVEVSRGVIDLVQPYIPESVVIIEADFTKWYEDQDLKKYDYVILDIWGNFSGDLAVEMCELYKEVGLPGAVWALSYVVYDVIDSVRGHEAPSDTAWEINSMFDWEALSEYIEGGYDDEDYYGDEDDGDLWEDACDDAILEAVDALYGLRL